MIQKILSPGLSPNVEAEDVLRACTMLLQPWKWKHGMSLTRVESSLSVLHAGADIICFNSARSSLYALLSCLDIGPGDEVIVQGFTCVAAVEPILWRDAAIRYVDIDDTYNVDPILLEKSITRKTKAIIVQHTFGIPADMCSIQKIAQKYKIFLIEDCAHALGGDIDGKRLGTWGDAAVISFGRDKVISSVYGGAAVVSTNHPDLSLRMRAYHKDLSSPTYLWIFQQLLHPIVCSVVIPLYTVGIGKILLYLFQLLGLLSFPIFPEEHTGRKPSLFPQTYCNGLAYLLETQIQKLERYVQQRKHIATYYLRSLGISSDRYPHATYLRFPMQVSHRDTCISAAKRRAILLGTWYAHVIDPKEVDLSSVGYVKGMCPHAESLAKGCINLPTMPWMTDDDMKRVMQAIV